MNFYDTVAGRRFFDHQLPGLTKALQGIANALSRPQPVIQVPTENLEKFLHDLFYGEYEPNLWNDSPQGRKYDIAIKSHKIRIREALSPELWELVEEYRILMDERNFFQAEKAFSSGYTTAIKMIAAGLVGTSPGQAHKEAGASHE